MFCGSQERTTAPTAVLTAAGPDVRVDDAQRQRTAVLLGDGAAAGLLTLDELDERLARTWAAGTAAELAAVEADLPPALRVRRDEQERAQRARASLGRHLTSYGVVLALLVAIWLVVGLSAGAWYPWPIWPALGMGIGVVGHVRAASPRRG